MMIFKIFYKVIAATCTGSKKKPAYPCEKAKWEATESQGTGCSSFQQ